LGYILNIFTMDLYDTVPQKTLRIE
jgi:hypothetical protein